MLEILAPAGGRSQLIAAQRSGADAVYLGAKGFNARRNAENFDEMGLAEAVKYCRARGVKVYVTLNTLVADSERAAFIEALGEAYLAGADAVLTQDLLAARLVRDYCPGMALHASTQMAVHNADGVRELEDYGFSRVVLARELSLMEIRRIRERTSAELEVFVHGAMCMSASGMCYLSSALGERSGNRGLCAQPCRLNFRALGREYALSLKDMCLMDHISELREAGVCSIKIEGRMKRAEYVACAVDAVKRARGGEEFDKSRLERAFSRGGFTDGYLTGRRDLRMFGRRTGEDVASEREYAPMRDIYRREAHSVRVDMALKIDEKSALTVSDGEREITVLGPAPDMARDAAITPERAVESLKKTGDTPFYAGSAEAEIAPGATLAVSQINAMRREALDALISAREILPTREFSVPPCEINAYRPKGDVKIRLRFEKFEQYFESDAEWNILPLREARLHPEALKIKNLAVELPALIYEGDKINLDGISVCVAENIGALRMCREAGVRVIGGDGLNIFNTSALEEYQSMGLESATISRELAMKKIAALGGEIERGVIAYGRLPLMRMRACPINSCASCPHEITDRLGVKFPVLCARDGYSTLHNSLPLYIGDKLIAGVDFATLYFTVEARRECERILEAFKTRGAPWFERTNGLYYKSIL